MKLKYIFISLSTLMLSTLSHAQLSLSTPEAKEQYEICKSLQTSYLNGKRINKQELFIITPAIEKECLSTAWNTEVNLKNVNFKKPFDEKMKNEIIKGIDQYSATNLADISGMLFENLLKTYKENNAKLPEKEKMMAKEVSNLLKQKIYNVYIPKEYMQIPQPQRNIALTPFLSSFKRNKTYFQQLDSILYPYQTSIDVINKIDKAITDEEKTKLVFTKDECEIAQTYFNTSNVISCKKH